MKQPATVVVMSILAVIMGIWSIINALRYLGLISIEALGALEFFGINGIGAIFSGLTAAIWFWTAGKIFNLDRRGLVFITLVAVVYLLFDLLAVLGGTATQSLSPSILLSIGVLGLSATTPTRRAFYDNTGDGIKK